MAKFVLFDVMEREPREFVYVNPEQVILIEPRIGPDHEDTCYLVLTEEDSVEGGNVKLWVTDNIKMAALRLGEA